MGADAPIGTFEGPILLARNFELTVQFYQFTLGLPVVGAAPYAKCISGACTFAIADGKWWGEANGSENPFQGESSVADSVLRIQVPNIDEAFERLTLLGEKFLSPPVARPRLSARNLFLRDPDGRYIMLTSPLR